MSRKFGYLVDWSNVMQHNGFFEQVDCKRGPKSDKEGFSSLMLELREAFDKEGFLLSAAVSPNKVVIDAGRRRTIVNKKFNNNENEKHDKFYPCLFVQLNRLRCATTLQDVGLDIRNGVRLPWTMGQKNWTRRANVCSSRRL